MPSIIYIVYPVCLYFLCSGIYKSQRRWLSCLYAVLGFVVFLVLYVIIVGLIANVNPMSVAATNKILDAGSVVALIPPILGANIPPRRA
jgi:hypothetical protein